MGLKERREREKQQRREQILNAARALLFKEGLQHTSVNKISKKAELSIGSIYFYFKNKEEIFAALEMEGLEILHELVINETKDIEDVETKLKKGAFAYHQFSEMHRNYFDVINYFLSSPEVYFSSDVNRTIDAKGASILKYVEGIVSEGVKQKIFKEKFPGNFAVYFWASLHGLVQMKKLRGTIIENDDFMSFYDYSVGKLIDSIRRKK